mmetsp:Transcript_5122/g.18480  ORF Transcript_5122/g.18480 Transcript_5122/m.18480 type:complete len:301 (+) Transcript_5122:125-1027(+)
MARKCSPPTPFFAVSQACASAMFSSVFSNAAYSHLLFTPVSRIRHALFLSGLMFERSRLPVQPASGPALMLKTAMPGMSVSSVTPMLVCATGSKISPKALPSKTSFISSLRDFQSICTKNHRSPLRASLSAFGMASCSAKPVEALGSYPGSGLYTVSNRSSSQLMSEKHRLLATALICISFRARVTMVCSCVRKYKTFLGFFPPWASTMRSRVSLKTTLLILLFGKNSLCSKVLEELHTKSSHFFLPRSSSRGREQKSSSQTLSSPSGMLDSGPTGSPSATARGAPRPRRPTLPRPSRAP